MFPVFTGCHFVTNSELNCWPVVCQFVVGPKCLGKCHTVSHWCWRPVACTNTSSGNVGTT